jgi:hypothetical protein
MTVFSLIFTFMTMKQHFFLFSKGTSINLCPCMLNYLMLGWLHRASAHPSSSDYLSTVIYIYTNLMVSLHPFP